MKKKNIILSIIYLFLGIIPHTYAHESLHKAVVIHPVADLIGQPIQSLFNNQSVQSAYNQIPLYSQDITNNQACARLHQVLFNEIVEIVETRGQEVCVKIPNMFYITHNSKEPHAKYWMHKSALIPLHTLHRKNIDISTFPKPIAYRSNNVTLSNKNTITLKAPFYDPITKKTYSAGTRFVCTDKPTKKTTIAVHIFDTASNTCKQTYVPKKICVFSPHTKQESRQTFVQILKEWAHQKDKKSIPYVWGGCSFITTYNTNKAIELTQKHNGGKLTFYTIPNNKDTIKTGLDCTGMVARAAQIADIPYFFKNSTTVAHHLYQSHNNEQVKIGDILWIPGHVMVVSDVDKNKIIEARAYEHGYGKVQEIPLHEQFKNMHTFQDLAHAIQNKKAIERFDKQKNIVKKINDMKILKLSSAWKK
jgi:hypothetical protein